MAGNDLIPAHDFCVYHRLEITFLYTLANRGLIDIVTNEQADYVPTAQLTYLEKLVRLHQDLSIHPDDLDVVSDLLDQLQFLRQQTVILENKLRFYD